MSRIAAVLAVLLFLAGPGPAAEPVSEGRVALLDLEGVPRLEVPRPRADYQACPLRRDGLPPGFVVRIDRQMPAETPDDDRFHVAPSPTVSGGRVFLGGGFFSRQFFAFDAATGRRLWTVALDDNGPSASVATRDRVITNTESCTTYSVTPTTGKTEWKRVLGPTLPTPPALCGPRLYVCLRHDDGSYALAALLASTGDTIWEAPLARENVGAPVVGLNRVFLTLATREAVCLDERTGKTLWSKRIEATSAPCLSSGGLTYATLSRGRVEIARLDPRDGRTLYASHAEPLEDKETVSTTMRRQEWLAPRCGWGDDPPRPEVVEPFVALGAGGEIVLFDETSGDVVRRLVLPEGRRLYAPPARIGGRLLYVTTDGLLLEIDLKAAAVRRALDLGVPVTSAPVADGGRVYLASRDLLLAVPWEAD